MDEPHQELLGVVEHHDDVRRECPDFAGDGQDDLVS